MIDFLIEWTIENAGILSLVVAIIGNPLAYSFGKKDKEPAYGKTTFNLISDLNEYENLNLLYNDESVEDFSVTKIVFWNKGRAPIRRGDIAEAEPIKIQLTKDNIRILEAKIISTNNSANQFTIEHDIESNWIHINFEFVNKKNGVVIEVVHNGKTNKDIELVGQVIGGKKITKLSLSGDVDHQFLKFVNKIATNKRIAPFVIWLPLVAFPTAVLMTYRKYPNDICGVLPIKIGRASCRERV